MAPQTGVPKITIRTKHKMIIPKNRKEIHPMGDSLPLCQKQGDFPCFFGRKYPRIRKAVSGGTSGQLLLFLLFKALFQHFIVVSVGFIAAIIGKQAIRQAVGGAVLDDTITTLAVIGTAHLGANTFLYIVTGHSFHLISAAAPRSRLC